jgi:hypothetical protein
MHFSERKESFFCSLDDWRLWYFPEHAFALVENVRIPLEGLRQLLCQTFQELHSSRLHHTITLYTESAFPIRVSRIRLYKSGSGSFHQHSTSKKNVGNPRFNLFCNFLMICYFWIEDWCKCTFSKYNKQNNLQKKNYFCCHLKSLWGKEQDYRTVLNGLDQIYLFFSRVRVRYMKLDSEDCIGTVSTLFM